MLYVAKNDIGKLNMTEGDVRSMNAGAPKVRALVQAKDLKPASKKDLKDTPWDAAKKKERRAEAAKAKTESKPKTEPKTKAKAKKKKSGKK